MLADGFSLPPKVDLHELVRVLIGCVVPEGDVHAIGQIRVAQPPGALRDEIQIVDENPIAPRAVEAREQVGFDVVVHSDKTSLRRRLAIVLDHSIDHPEDCLVVHLQGVASEAVQRVHGGPCLP